MTPKIRLDKDKIEAAAKHMLTEAAQRFGLNYTEICLAFFVGFVSTLYTIITEKQARDGKPLASKSGEAKA